MKHDERLLIIGLFHGMFYSGWWLSHPSEKYEFVNGKDDIPYIVEKTTRLKSPISSHCHYHSIIIPNYIPINPHY